MKNEANKLVELLKTETQTLKTQYLEKTKEWAILNFEKHNERKNWREIEWCKFLGLTPEVKNPNCPENIQYLGFPKNFYNTSKARELSKYQKDMRNVIWDGLEKYISKEMKHAELHYESSIKKLANRIEKKGLNQDNISIVTSHIGININTTLTDGIKTVRAYTIIAEGDIQKPHYRYLVK